MSVMMREDKYLSKEVRAVAPPKRKKLGEILVEKGILTELTVERILALSRKSGKRFGTVLEELGLVTGEELAQALADQYKYKYISNISRHQFSREVLKVIHVEAAVEHTVFPLKIQNNTLGIAMMDPTNERFINILKQDLQMQVYPFIATRKDINAAIAKFYLNKEMKEKDENTILVVDDDKLILTIISNILQSEGYKIITAMDGMDAYKKIICNQPRLIITDKEMPKFNGYALLDSLKNIPETRNIPVILLSGALGTDEEALAYEKGFFDYVQKPLNEKSFKARIRRAMKAHGDLAISRF